METLSYTPPSTLLSVARSCVVLVDYQVKLMPAIAEQDNVIRAAHRLAKVAQLFNIPLMATEQNPQRLGPTIAPLHEYCESRLEKVHFDACAHEGLTSTLPEGLSQVVMAGCEAHVCLLQTGLSLLQQGYQVFVVEEASGSRRPEEKALGIRRLENAGATVISVEMAAFEWAQTYQHPKFKALLEVIKPL